MKTKEQIAEKLDELDLPLTEDEWERLIDMIQKLIVDEPE